MAIFAAITYTRARLEAGWFHFADERRSDLLERTGSLNREIKAQLKSQTLKQTDLFDGTLVEPRVSVGHLVSQLRKACPEIDHLTIAGYGPFVQDDPSKPDYGLLHKKAAPPFAGQSVYGLVKAAFGERAPPISLINDCAAVAFFDYWKRHRPGRPNSETIAALIVGRGIGGGIVRPGRLGAIGSTLSEIGHIRVHHHKEDTLLDSPTCDFHEGCLTSHASWRAVIVRAKKMGTTLAALEKAPDHIIWQLQADYLAQACLTLVLTNAPTRIVLGGSMIDKAPFLIPQIRSRLAPMIGDFLPRANPLVATDFIDKVDRDDSLLSGGLHNSINRWLWRPTGVR